MWIFILIGFVAVRGIGRYTDKMETTGKVWKAGFGIPGEIWGRMNKTTSSLNSVIKKADFNVAGSVSCKYTLSFGFKVFIIIIKQFWSFLKYCFFQASQ